jgi:hypothetical protein
MPLLGLFSTTRAQREKTRRAAANQRRWGDSEPFDFEWDVRADQFSFNRAMLDNTAYKRSADGGFRELILRETFNIECTDETLLAGYYAPVRSIVDAYQNVFRGTYGQEIRVDEKVDDRDVNPLLADATNSPVRRIWRWSNLDTQKQTMQEWAANLGSVGLRIVGRNDPDALNRRVSIQIEHPGAIVDFDEDDRGNITEIELRYTALAGELGEKRHEVKVREVLSKTEFVKEIDGTNVLDANESTNELGVCPYVILRHRDDGHEFGRWAYHGSEDIIHGLNWLISNQSESIHKHIWPNWFAAGGGAAPTEFFLGRERVAYVKLEPDTPPPIFQPLVADLDQAGSTEFWNELMARLQERQPELIIGNIKALSGQSGETIAKLLKPAEAVIARARANYEHALIRAVQIGLSEGIRMSLWDLGTGGGSTEAADRAYRAGKEDFAFAERPALPQSAYDQEQQAKADSARPMAKMALARAADGLVDQQEQLHLAGYTEKEIGEILQRKTTQGAIPTEPL